MLVIPSLLSTDECKYLAGLYQSYEDKWYYLPDVKVSRNVLGFEVFHDALKVKMESWIGQDVRLGDSHVLEYLVGSRLKEHVDKGEGVLDIVVPISANPIRRMSSWPLIIGGLPARLDVGDGVLYEGSTPHRREYMPTTLNSATIALFCYYRKEMP